MGRRQKEGLDYFPHDTDASSDEKVEALRLLYGNDGYTFYFVLLERIYRAGAELDISDTETRRILAGKISVDLERFEQMIESALKAKLFDRDAYNKHGILTSNGIKARASVVFEKRKRASERYHKNTCGKNEEQKNDNKNRQQKSATEIDNRNITTEINNRKGTTKTDNKNTHRKEKKRKEKDSKEKEILTNLSLIENPDDLAGYFDDVLLTVESPDYVINGYQEALIALKQKEEGKFLAVVYKEIGRSDGFIITA